MKENSPPNRPTPAACGSLRLYGTRLRDRRYAERDKLHKGNLAIPQGYQSMGVSVLFGECAATT
jgi:hypothetical protein